MARVFSVLTRRENYFTCSEIIVDVLGSSSKFNVIFDGNLCWFNCYGTKPQEQRLRDMLITL